MSEFDASKLTQVEQYKLLVGTVTPRPIALVTTLGPAGPNAAPFSFFNAVGSDPAMVCFSVGNKPGGAKDTVANIRDCPEFVVHIGLAPRPLANGGVREKGQNQLDP